MKYETVIGLEVHAELATLTKLFCGCPTRFGAEPNDNTCPACVGMPGLPPVLNKKCVELAIAAGLLTNCEIAERCYFDKKNYFYPDLPSGYQVTQYFAPICKNGFVEIEAGGEKKKITIKQIHIEEDAGKLVHEGDKSLIDYNRSSVPLIEIVSNADFRSAKEAVAYLEELRSLLSFAGVSDCKMQEGSMRCDINISVREAGSETLGTRVEIKNMNSLKAISSAIEYEAGRQIEALETGCEKIIQETRRWDDARCETFSMREKEDATDYRYFPNPEIMPLHIGGEWISEIRNSLPETARDKFSRLTDGLGLSGYDAGIITNSGNLSRIFDGTMEYFPKPKEIANWIITELLSVDRGRNKSEEDVEIDCAKFAALMRLVDEKIINRGVAKKLLVKILEEDIEPAAYVAENNLAMVSDAGLIERAVREAIAENEKSVSEYKSGTAKALGFLVGKVMKKTEGKADPKLVNELLVKFLS